MARRHPRRGNLHGMLNCFFQSRRLNSSPEPRIVPEVSAGPIRRALQGRSPTETMTQRKIPITPETVICGGVPGHWEKSRDSLAVCSMGGSNCMRSSCGRASLLHCTECEVPIREHAGRFVRYKCAAFQTDRSGISGALLSTREVLRRVHASPEVILRDLAIEGSDQARETFGAKAHSVPKRAHARSACGARRG